MLQALSWIKSVLSKAYFILSAASGCVDAIIKPRVGISAAGQTDTDRQMLIRQ